jgi:hypothetical protein
MALTSGMVWEVRPSGDDENGGGFNPFRGGDDYSQQDMAEASVSDLIVWPVNTRLINSPGRPAVPEDAGNSWRLQQTGSWIPGVYEIVSVSGDWHLLDRPAYGLPEQDNLIFWYDASALTGLNDDDLIATITDQSGLGHDATQSNNAKKATYKTSALNGLPVIRTTHTSGTYDITSPAISNQSFTLYVVVNYQINQAGLGNLLETPGASGGLNYRLDDTTSPAPSVGWDIEGVNSYTSAVSGAQILAWILDKAASVPRGALYRNNSSILTGFFSSNGFSFGSGIDVLFGGFGFALMGDVAEIIFYKAAHNSTQRNNVMTYLNNKWAIY